MAQDINRLKVVLVEQKRTNKWFAEQLDKAISEQMAYQCIATLFRDFGGNRQKPQCGIRELLWHTKE